MYFYLMKTHYYYYFLPREVMVLWTHAKVHARSHVKAHGNVHAEAHMKILEGAHTRVQVFSHGRAHVLSRARSQVTNNAGSHAAIDMAIHAVANVTPNRLSHHRLSTPWVLCVLCVLAHIPCRVASLLSGNCTRSVWIWCSRNISTRIVS